MAEYNFILQASGQTRVAHPIWKSDLALEYGFEQNQQFRRATLSGQIIFQLEDYDWIMAMTFETKFYLTIQVDWSHSGTYADYWRGSFHRTDCTINTDDRMITVKPEVEDRYNAILAGMDKEYDLIKLKPTKQQVDYYRRAMLQVYVAGEDIVNCYLGGMHWEQEATQSYDDDDYIRGAFKFGVMARRYEIAFEGNPPVGLQEPFFGTCDHGTSSGVWDDFSNEEGIYFIQFVQGHYYSPAPYYAIVYQQDLRIRSYADPDTLLYEFHQEQLGAPPPIPTSFTFTNLVAGQPDLQATSSYVNIYGRLLLGKNFENSYQLPSDDIVANDRNYKYCFPYPQTGLLRSTSRHSSDPTEWGVRPDGTTYYLPPLLSADEALLINVMYPVAQSAWRYSSIWLLYDVGTEFTEDTYKTQTTLRDGYTIEAAISALLGEIAPNVTFQATAAYSQFLFGTNPLTNDWGRLVMTPKSNILVAEYSQPAQTAMVRLQEIFALLKNAMACYWFIDDQNRLRIEHISWFKNGGSYTGTPAVGYDLTQMFNNRNGRTWALATGTYQFEKIDMAQRWEYEWADKTTDIFKGDAIEVISTFVQEGKIEEISIAQFNSDLDYILLNPSDVSQDGFALLLCKIVGDVWQTDFKTFNIPDGTFMGKTFTVQNPQLTMRELQPNFLISDMSAWSIKVNDTATTAKGIQRKKQQQLNMPVGNQDVDTMKLIHTTIGNGEIQKMTLNLSSRMAKITLRYDTV